MCRRCGAPPVLTSPSTTENAPGNVASELAKAITELEASPDKYRAMDSPNGWGTYDHLVPALHRLLVQYRAHPLASVYVWS